MAETGDGCYYNWYKAYIEKDRGCGNFFSEYGGLFHDIIEKLHKGEMLLWDVDDEIKKGMQQFKFNVPFAKMRNSYDNSIYKFFEEFEDVFVDYDIQQAEEEKQFEIDGIKLRGYPDLLGQHTKAGMFIGDYKSSKPYIGEKLIHNVRQMYLYSIPFFNEYGYFPDSLIYIFLREKTDREVIIKFDMDELNKTKQWVVDTVRKIENHKTEWTPRCSLDGIDSNRDFFATQLCNHRLTCEFKCS
jgi:hypothetical protein